MSVDVDAVNERLNGLVTLLKAVGVSGEDARGMASTQKDGQPALDVARQLDDEQIEAIIKKLQKAQTEAPQIIAALEAHAEARSLTGAGSWNNSKKGKVQEEEVVEEVEEEEDDDEFDEDANYPMVGHGVSDDISVVSDLTTPTVVASPHVPDEEHYRDALPPMIIGGVGEPSMVISAPKRKNLVSQVRAPGLLAPPGRRNTAAGGAAAARRKMYQDTMAKLHENPNGMGYVGPAGAGMKSKSSSSTPKAPSSTPTRTKKKTSSKKTSSMANPAMSNDWNSFNDPVTPSKPPKKSSSSSNAPTVIDDDGFLVGDTDFDPFSTSGSNPFKSSAGDLEFGSSSKKFSSSSSASGGFASFGHNASSGSVGGGSAKVRKPKVKKEVEQRKSRARSDAGPRGPRRSRRASMV